VCSELVKDFPRYFINHPECKSNPTCGGQRFTCDAACPAPKVIDACGSHGHVCCTGSKCNGSLKCVAGKCR